MACGSTVAGTSSDDLDARIAREARDLGVSEDYLRRVAYESYQGAELDVEPPADCSQPSLPLALDKVDQPPEA